MHSKLVNVMSGWSGILSTSFVHNIVLSDYRVIDL